ncbi:MAG: alpha/beta hydrolase [Veillonellaceae bacterium]|nr:alpha/beta hydrolase [Veillonellaceae bacterium]
MQTFFISSGISKLPVALHEPIGKNLGTALIICHGFRGSMDGGGRAVKLANRAAAFGYTVIRFAFTPVKELSTQIRELSAIVDYCRRNILSKIILLGRSMGGSCSLVFAAHDERIAGLCLWATPCNLYETFQLSLGANFQLLVEGKTVKLTDQYGNLVIRPSFIEDFKFYDLLACVRNIKSPVLIIHGSQDEVVPIEQAKQMWNYAKNPKKLVVIEGGDHQFSGQADLAADNVIEWLKHNFS